MTQGPGRILFAFVFLLVSFLSTLSHAQEPLKIAITDNYPPYSVIGPTGRPFGLFVDMWKEWSRATGTPVEFVISSWPDTIENVRSGKADIHSGLYHNDQRAQFLDFSDPIHIGRTSLHFSDPDIAPLTLDKMQSMTVGAVSGTYQQRFLRERFPHVKVREFPDAGAMVTSVMKNEIDAVISESVAIEASLARMGLRGVIQEGAETLFKNFVLAGVQKGRKDIVRKINNGFRRVDRSRLAQIEKRWLTNPADYFYSSQTQTIDLSAEEEAWLQENPVTRIAVTTFIEPVDITNDQGHYTGLNADLLKIMQERTGLTIVPEFFDQWPRLVEKTLNGEVDGAMSFSITPERAKKINYTNAYAYDPVVVITQDGEERIKKWKDLNGLKLSAGEGLAYVDALKADFADNLRLVANERAGLNMVRDGLVDAHISTMIFFGNEQKATFIPGLKIAASRAEEGGALRFGIHKNKPVLFSIMKKGLAAITQDELTALREKWLRPRDQSAPSAVLLNSEETQWLKTHPITRIAVLKNWAPYDMRDESGRHKGMHADILRLINRHLGTNLVAWPFDTWKEAYQKALTAEADGILGLSWTKARETDFYFSTAYHYKPADFVMRASDEPINEWEKLDGKTIHVRAKASLIDKIKAELPNAVIKQFSSEEAALKALAKGEGDGYLAWVGVSEAFLRDNGLRITAQIDDRQGEFTLGVAKTKPIVASIVQKGLNSITQSEWVELKEKWLMPPQKDELGLTEEERNWLAENPSVEIATMEAWPPISFIGRNGEIEGINAILVDTLNEKLNGLLTLKPGPFKDNFQKVKNKELPALLDITPTAERQAHFHFTEAYFKIPHVYIARDDADYIAGESDLKGKVMALEEGFGNVKWFKENVPGLTIKEYPDTSLALGAVSRGEADVYAGNRAVGVDILEREFINNVKIHGRVGRPVTTLAIGVRKDWPILRDILDKALANISLDEKSSIHQKWMAKAPNSVRVTNRLTLSAEEKEYQRKNPVIRVHNEMDWPPFDFNQEGRPTGFSVDYMRLIAEKTGFEIEHVTGPSWSEFLGMMRDGSLDVMVNIVKTPEREKYISYTDPYVNNPPMVITRTGSDVQTFDNLFGRTVCVPKGYFYQEIIETQFPAISLVLTKDQSDCLKQVSAGHVDATIGGLAVQDYLIKKLFLSNLAIVSTIEYPAFSNDLRIGIRKDLPMLQQILQRAVQDVREEEVASIREKWFSTQGPVAKSAKTQTDVMQIVLIVGGISIGLIVLLMIIRTLINRLVKREVTAAYQSQEVRGTGLLLVAVFLSVVVIGAWVTAGKTNVDFRNNLRDQLETVRDTTLEAIRTWVESEKRHLKIITTDQMIVASVADLVKLPPDAETLRTSDAVSFIRYWFSSHENTAHSHDFAVLSLNGVVLASSKDETLGKPHVLQKMKPELVSKAAAGAEQFVAPFQTPHMNHAKPNGHNQSHNMGYYLMPILGKDKKVLALLAMPYNPHHDLTGLTQLGRLGETGETYLFDSDGLMTTDSRYTQDLIDLSLIEAGQSAILNLPLRDPLHRLVVGEVRSEEERSKLPLTLMAEEALSGKSGSNIEGYRDYRGVHVLGAWSWIPEYGLGIATEQDEAEAMATFWTLRNTMLIVLGVAVVSALGLTGLSVWIGQSANRSLRKARDNLEIEVRERTRELNFQKFAMDRHAIVSATDPNGKITYVNDKFVEISGYDRDTLIGANHRLLKSGKHTELFYTEMWNTISSGEVWHGELCNRCKDGQLVWMAASIIPFTNEEDEIERYISIRTDITERKAAEQKIMDSEKRIRSIIENAVDGIIVMGQDGIVQGFSPAAEEIFGYNSGEVVGQNIKMLMPEPDRSAHDGYLAAYSPDRISSTVGRNRETIGLRKDGSTFPMDLAVGSSLIRDEYIFTGIVRDITTRKEAEAALNESEERNRLLLTSAGSGIFGVDTNGIITFVNPRCIEMLGYSEDELLGVKAHPLFHHTYPDGSHYPVENCWMYKSFTEGQSYRIDDEMLWCKDGSPIPIEYNSTPVFRDGEIVGAVIAFNDISERLEAQRERDDALEVISSSINYASNIQRAVLTGEDMIQATMQDYFVLWEPRDVVGGDIYWCHMWGGMPIVIAADCTGHGVPGAFMTLISTGALDRAMAEIEPGNVGQLIQRMHQVIQFTLNQHGKQGESDDGLELGICCLDTIDNQIVYAGARFSLFMVQDGEITEFKGTKSGIGYRNIPQDQEFAENRIALEGAQQSFYMSTDGFFDQIGGLRRRMFGKKRFKQILLDAQGKPMAEQRDMLHQGLKDYQGDETRRDDVTMIGFIP
ncbi:transporter substrate-binding domain-containing protein [Terasakiella sp. A23]|uniref:transporter substrate-binding domain-containing protein n=1 Tax=Terasakiella sp. FCG-A23 TaxID=3080561 RepID=UPI00295376BB|nr:transporter substrate-binding domain-containing protein [Terasakiella sp. A23]MDV7339617.1 transporter substrate-binding domain-containing protein [Terasakiella sp. A23]